MKFDLAWMRSHMEAAADADAIADGLTDCGFLVEVRDPAGDSEIWDIDVTTNRPDAMNHRGLAREAAVACGGTLKPLDIALDEGDEAAEDFASVVIEDAEGCGRFVGRVVRGIVQKPSPEWLQQRLVNIGVRPINNVVDITNYVLHETGQPLHAYDLNLLAGRKIIVRCPADGEMLTTLDGEERKLEPDMLVIADAERAIGLAGVMGGENTEINDDTVDVLIEAASFDALTVRRMARRLGMHTDASHRFERGCDPEMAPVAADLAAAMLAELADGTVCRGRIDVYPRAHRAAVMPLTAERVSAFAGLPIAADRIIEIFEGLGFAPMREGDDIVVTAPSHRVDIQVTADLYEEVIRHVGYNTVPSVLPPTGTPPGHRHPNWELVDRGRNAAVACGLEEALTYAFIDPDDDARVAAWPLCPGKPIPLDNPLARQQGTMRRSLVPGLLTSARDAVNQGERSIALFEQGRAFAAKDASGAHEPERLGVVLAGAAAGHAADEVGFADLKGVVESLLDRIGFVDCGWSRGGAPWLDEQQGAIITDGRGAAIGAAGLLSAAEAKHFGFKIPVYVAELDLQAAPAELPLPRFAALPRFPEITADTTVEHGADLDYADLETAVLELADEHVESVQMLVRYSGKGLPANRVRTTVRLVYRHPDRSLTQDEVNEAQADLRDGLVQQLGVAFA
jgi:phenylalanyl-tRNA synthetase beta chain